MSDSRRSSKPWSKPPSWFKKERRQNDRARSKQTMRVQQHLEDGPEISQRPHNDQYDWT